jgi:hypothetical protein
MPNCYIDLIHSNANLAYGLYNGAVPVPISSFPFPTYHLDTGTGFDHQTVLLLALAYNPYVSELYNA